MLTGRQRELERIEGLLGDTRQGRGGVLLVRGEPGIGKTALLAEARAHAHDMTVLPARGVESEAEFPFAGLHEVLNPALDALGELPVRQADALRSALGLGPPGQFEFLVIGAATLSLLAAAADRRPLLVLLDDVQWLDRASVAALLFAARRLGAEPIAVIAATRDEARTSFDRAGFDELVVGGLDLEASAALLSPGHSALSTNVVQRIHRETGGNPLALIEAARQLFRDPAAGQSPLSLSLSSAPQLEDAFARRIAALSTAAREAVLVAAASDTGAIGEVVRALAQLGRSPTDLAVAEDAGLIALGDSIEFRHPLARSAAYHVAPPSQRRQAHAALAHALANEPESEERVWHLARSILIADEQVAAELESMAARMVRRSGFPAAAAALERAASLTPDDGRRSERLVAAAEAAWLAGDAPGALRLLARVEKGALATDLAVRARAFGLKGHIFNLCGPAAEAGQILREAAEVALLVDRGQAISALADAHECFIWAGDGGAALEVAERLTAIADRSDRAERFFADLVMGSALLFTDRTKEGLTLVASALRIQEAHDVLRSRPRYLAWAGIGHGWLGQSQTGRSAILRAIAEAEEQQAVAVLPRAMTTLAGREFELGNWSAAYAASTRAVGLARELGHQATLSTALVQVAAIEAGRGQDRECRIHAADALDLAQRLGRPNQAAIAHHALGLLELGLDHPDAAAEHLARASTAVAGGAAPAFSRFALPDLIEARVRSSDIGDLAGLGAALSQMEARIRSPLEAALAARSRALLEPIEYERHLRLALSHHDGGNNTFAEARTRLLFGELLRRDNRRIEARGQLRTALILFDALGALPWSLRTRRELRASGESIRRRDPTAAEQLTPQELQIAYQVAEGKSNREVGLALFLSPKTVEFHLTRIYRKLGLNSRAQLIRLFAAQPVTPEQAIPVPRL